MSLTGVIILAGGQGARLGGVDKSRIELGGVALVERLADRLRPLGVPIFVAAPKGTDPQVPAGTTRLFDETDARGMPMGPLGGLAGALAIADRLQDTATILTVPVDTPFFPADFAARAEAQLVQNTNVVIGRYGDNTYPLTALWRVGALRKIAGYLAARPASWSVRRFLDLLSVTHTDYSDSDENPFRGINTPAELAAISSAGAVRQ